jgi:outer membrane biosynthesis protein TonB
VLAVLVHVLVASTLWMNWTPSQKDSLLVRPNIVKAELIVMEAPKPKATPKPAPMAPPEAAKPKPPEPKPEAKPAKEAKEKSK